MTGSPLLDWAVLSVSLFNTILLLWLGLTVLFTAERRSLGVWLLNIGLLLGAGFFVSHTAILGGGLRLFSSALNFWWRTGWLPVIVAPLAWYGLLLWFAGFWVPAASSLRRRHRLWLILMSGLMVSLLVLLYVGHGLPTFVDITQLDLSGSLTIGGLPVLLVVYPLYMVLCITLAVDALRHPGGSDRFMGDVARRRTYPWLLAASLTLLAVSILVGWFMLWAISTARTAGDAGPTPQIMQAAGWFDLGVELLIALAVIFIGQAIVSYEIFTGQSLPRREFFRHWRDAILLAGGYAILVGGSIVLNLNFVYSLLLTTILMVVFYALFGWRSFVHRDRFMAHLRPFVGSQNLMQQITSGQAKSAASTIFDALCEQVLNTDRAQIIPGPSLSELVARTLIYPPGAQAVSMPSTADLIPPPGLRLRALPEPFEGLEWAVGLQAAGGQIGVLLLGDKVDGGVYTQEEIEIAQATGERLLDMLAGEETARRLMAMQRRRLSETQILDHQTRRALHDEVLPDLHTAILGLDGSADAGPAIEILTQLHHRISDLIYTHPGLRFDDSDTDLAAKLRTLLASEFSNAFTSVTWHGLNSLVGLSALAQEVLFYATREALRNASLHGRGAQPQRDLHLTITLVLDDAIIIRVQDDGVGLSKGIEHNRQGGWALHSTMLALLGGTMTWEPSLPSGSCVEITVPEQHLISHSPGSAG